MTALMWNPLTLPFVALGLAANVARAIAGIPRATAALEQGLDRLDRLTHQGDAVLAELEHARPALTQIAESAELVERLMKGGDDMVSAADRTREEAAAVRALIEQTRPSVDRLAEYAEPILEASISAREQLKNTERELQRANESVERMLEMAQPLERVTGRMERLTGAFRRNPAPGPGQNGVDA